MTRTHLPQPHDASQTHADGIETDLAQALQSNPSLALLLADKPVAFHSIYLKLMGERREAVRDAMVLSKLVELEQSLEASTQGWFCLDTQGWVNLLDLPIGQQAAARKSLQALGYLEQVFSGFPRTAYYRLDVRRLKADIIQLGQRYVDEQKRKQAAVVMH